MDDLLKDTVEKNGNARGLAIIFCNNYENAKNFEKLRGTIKDGRAMKETFHHLGFATIILENATKDMMCGIIKALATYMNYPRGYNCYAVVFSGHGSNNKTIISGDGEMVNFEEALIWPLENAPLIRSSPKIVLIDACRGSRELHAKGYPPEAAPLRFDLSLWGNILVAYSTMEGFKSYEDSELGGIWMQKLAAELKTSRKSVSDIVADVNKMMKDRYSQEPQIWNTTVNIVLSAHSG